MPNRFLLSPFFLEQPLPAAARLAQDEWRLNEPAFDGDDQVAVMAAVHRSLADLVTSAMRAGERPVSIAGDCCSTIGVLAGLQRAGLDPLLLWLDAHGDFNTWETTPSGFIGGMPLAMLVGRGDQGLVEAAGLRPLSEGNVVLADARDLDPGERELLEQSQVNHVRDLAALAAALPADRPLYVHLDPDLIDPRDAPAMLYPAADGPRLPAVCELAEWLARERQVVAASLTLWHLDADSSGETERACLGALAALIG
jgi:arginase